MNLKHRWVESIDDIGELEWARLYGKKSVFKSYGFNHALQESQLVGVKFHYLLILENEIIQSILPCFSYEVKLEILAGDSVKNIANIVRKIYSNFLCTKLFVIGSPVATCENHISLLENDDSDSREYVFNLLVEKSKNLKIPILIFKEIPNAEIDGFKNYFNKVEIFESLPNSFVPISVKDFPYPSMLRKRYRQRFKKAIRKSDEANYKWEFIGEYAHLIPEMHRLYLNVYEKSEYKFEKLTLEFFENVYTHLQNESFLLTCRDSKGNLICSELIIEGENELIPMYLGLDYNYIADSIIYQNVIFRTLLEAEKKNKNWMVLGQTSYLPKAYSGALFEKLYLGIYSPKTSLKFMIKYGFKYLFPEFVKPEVNNISERIKEKSAFKGIIEKSKKIFE